MSTVLLRPTEPIPIPETEYGPFPQGRPVDPNAKRNARESFIRVGRQPIQEDALKVVKEVIPFLEAPRIHPSYWKQLGLEVRDVPIRSTARKRFLTCPRRFMWEERLGLVPRGEYSAALEIGSFFHELVAPLYQGMPLENLGRLVHEKVGEIYSRLEEVVDSTGMLPNGLTISEQLDRVEKDIKMSAALVAVFGKYLPPSELLKSYDVVSVEQVYAIKVPRLAVPLVVQPDVLLRNKKTGRYWIVDHKTTSEDMENRTMVLNWEFQPQLYAFVVHHYLKAENPDAVVGGYIHNVIRKPSIRQKQTETFDQYIDRVHDWFREQSETNPENPPLSQSTVPITGPIATEEFLAQVYMTGKACTAELNLGRFHKNEAACFGMYGRRPCPFLQLCATERTGLRDWPRFIKENFSQEWRHWEDTK